VFGHGMDNEKGKALLKQWDNAGHWIGNHTYSHKSFNKEETTTKEFIADFLKNDSLISSFENYVRNIPFPLFKRRQYQGKKG
jgi:peptidoglycan-N-acetylglucosamine deacetylase